MREAHVERSTKETVVALDLNLDGTGVHTIATPVPFLNHLLAQVATHGLVDINLRATGDTAIDDHHTVEDVGIVLGQALRQALGDSRGIARYGSAIVPLDEALALVAVDLSGRAYLAYDVSFRTARTGGFETSLVEDFLRAFATNGRLTLHARMVAGRSSHHIAEALFKALGRALCQAVAADPRREGVPSTKGAL